MVCSGQSHSILFDSVSNAMGAIHHRRLDRTPESSRTDSSQESLPTISTFVIFSRTIFTPPPSSSPPPPHPAYSDSYTISSIFNRIGLHKSWCNGVENFNVNSSIFVHPLFHRLIHGMKHL